MNNFSEEEKILTKIKNNEELNIDELEDIVFSYGIETKIESREEWYYHMSTLSKLNNTYVVTKWKEGITEYNGCEFENQPILVKEIKSTDVIMTSHYFYDNSGRIVYRIVNGQHKFEY